MRSWNSSAVSRPRRGARAAVPPRGRDPRPRRGFAGHQAPGILLGRRNAFRVLLPSIAEAVSVMPGARRIPDSPPSSAVSTHGPSAVIATVCSKCAARLPSAVTTVQPSSSRTVSGPPSTTIGSMASAMPGRSRGPAARPPVVGHRRVHVHRAADAVADVLLDHAVPAGPADAGLHRVRDVAEAAPGAGLGQPVPQRGLARLEQGGVRGGDGAHADGEGRVAVPAADDGAAVDGDHVAVAQSAAGSGCRARSPRSPRCRSSPGSRGSP